MKVGLIVEGDIDKILLPDLLRNIAYNHTSIKWNVDIEPDSVDLLIGRKRGHGAVLKTIEKIISSPEVFESYSFFIVLIDKRANTSRYKIEELLKNEPRFIYGYAKQEIESWVLAERDGIVRWLNISTKEQSTIVPLQESFNYEKDPDPKITLTNLMNSSNSTDFSSWTVGAAKEFVEASWQGDLELLYYSQVWTGNANIDRIYDKCKEGFRPFFHQVLNRLSPIKVY